MVFEQFWVLGGVVLQPLGAFLGPKMQPGGDKKRNQKRDPKINKNKGTKMGAKSDKKGTPKRYQKEASEADLWQMALGTLLGVSWGASWSLLGST